ncbi:MAG: metalloregulator ArsR/SmtB family transcription factor [Nitrospirota bacterium]|nr:metalloregulator ArsR/SmtB family transcription factor [Nitrospirota bacterium]MDH5769004.1 metalloregulator ArsR/SmtB family transcription factor [Nitrospirota bacterium]
MHKSAYMNMDKHVDIFKALSDNTRLRIMRLLIHAGRELCVCEITDSLQESHYNVSRQLKELKIAGLVREQKAGRWVLYSILKAKDKFQKFILHAVENIPEDIFITDLQRLKIRLSLRKDGKCVIGLKSKEWGK